MPTIMPVFREFEVAAVGASVAVDVGESFVIPAVPEILTIVDDLYR